MTDDPKPLDSMWAHVPLPYRVTVRSTMTPDSAPVRHEVSVMAYSVFEAVMQASMTATGQTPDASKLVIERVEPDLVAYFKLLTDRTLELLKAARAK